MRASIQPWAAASLTSPWGFQGYRQDRLKFKVRYTLAGALDNIRPEFNRVVTAADRASQSNRLLGMQVSVEDDRGPVCRGAIFYRNNQWAVYIYTPKDSTLKSSISFLDNKGNLLHGWHIRPRLKPGSLACQFVFDAADKPTQEADVKAFLNHITDAMFDGDAPPRPFVRFTRIEADLFPSDIARMLRNGIQSNEPDMEALAAPFTPAEWERFKQEHNLSRFSSTPPRLFDLKCIFDLLLRKVVTQCSWSQLTPIENLGFATKKRYYFWREKYGWDACIAIQKFLKDVRGYQYTPEPIPF